MDDEDEQGFESKFAPGTPDRILADHLNTEGFGYWVNPDEVVDEVRKIGWAPVNGSHDSGSESPHSAANGSADAADSAR